MCLTRETAGDKSSSSSLNQSMNRTVSECFTVYTQALSSMSLRPRPAPYDSASSRPSSAAALPTSPTSGGGVAVGVSGASRRSSSVSSIGAVSKSRSLLSNGAGTAEGPVIEGNLQVSTMHAQIVHLTAALLGCIRSMWAKSLKCAR